MPLQMGGRERRVKQDTPRITLERYNSLCPPGKKKDKMAVSRGHFSDMATGTHVVMTVIAENTDLWYGSHHTDLTNRHNTSDNAICFKFSEGVSQIYNNAVNSNTLRVFVNDH